MILLFVSYTISKSFSKIEYISWDISKNTDAYTHSILSDSNRDVRLDDSGCVLESILQIKNGSYVTVLLLSLSESSEFSDKINPSDSLKYF